MRQKYWLNLGGCYEETNRELVDMEKRYDLLRFKIAGWCVWPLLRFSVGSILQGLEMPPSKQRYHTFDRLVSGIRDIYNILFIGRKMIIVVAYDSNLSEIRSGKYLDIFFDDLLLDIGGFFKIMHLSNPIFKNALRSAIIKPDMTSSLFQIAAKFSSRFSFSKEVSQISRHLTSILHTNRALRKITKHTVYSIVSQFYWSFQLYKWLFRQIRPKYLFIVTAYCDHAIVAAAKSEGITTIEFQHGYISPWHTGYSWSEYAKPYKKSMPIPDKIFLYGEYWREALLSSGFWEEAELPVVGSLRIDHHREKVIPKPQNIVRLLLTTQPISVDETIAFMTQFLKEYNMKFQTEIYIKLHPGETDKSKYDHAFRGFNNVKVVSSVETPSTLDLMRSSHLHVSVSSTCHYEALALGVPTAIIPARGYELALPLTQFREYVFLLEEPADMARLIPKLKEQEIMVPSTIGDIFFSTNALANMKANL